MDLTAAVAGGSQGSLNEPSVQSAHSPDLVLPPTEQQMEQRARDHIMQGGLRGVPMPVFLPFQPFVPGLALPTQGHVPVVGAGQVDVGAVSPQ